MLVNTTMFYWPCEQSGDGAVRFRSILYTEDRGEVEDRRDTTGMNVVWGIR